MSHSRWEALLLEPAPLADDAAWFAAIARRLLCGCSTSAPSPRPAPQAASVDQRSRRHRFGLVQPPAGLLPAMGGKGRCGAHARLNRRTRRPRLVTPAKAGVSCGAFSVPQAIAESFA